MPTGLRPALGIINRYRAIFASKPFVCSWLTSALAFSCHFGFITLSPLIFLQVLKVSPLAYAGVLLMYGAAYVLAGVLATRLAKTLSVDTQINTGLLLAATAGLVMLVLLRYPLTIGTVALPMILCTLGTTLVRPAAASRAMEMFSENAGTASAAGGTILFVTAGVVSVLLAYLPFSPLHSLATFIMVATVMGYGLNKWSRLANRVSKNNQQRGIATTQR